MQSRKKKEKKQRPPYGVPKPIEVEDLEPSTEYEDREEIRRIFAKEIEEIKKDAQFYE